MEFKKEVMCFAQDNTDHLSFFIPFFTPSFTSILTPTYILVLRSKRKPIRQRQSIVFLLRLIVCRGGECGESPQRKKVVSHK